MNVIHYEAFGIFPNEFILVEQLFCQNCDVMIFLFIFFHVLRACLEVDVENVENHVITNISNLLYLACLRRFIVLPSAKHRCQCNHSFPVAKQCNNWRKISFCLMILSVKFNKFEMKTRSCVLKKNNAPKKRIDEL